jgi:hypothetical protein
LKRKKRNSFAYGWKKRPSRVARKRYGDLYIVLRTMLYAMRSYGNGFSEERTKGCFVFSRRTLSALRTERSGRSVGSPTEGVGTVCRKAVPGGVLSWRT